MNGSVVLIGAGGHCKVIVSILKLCSKEKVIILDNNENRIGEKILGYEITGTDKYLLKYKPTEVALINCIGSTNSTNLRSQVYEKFKKLGYKFDSVIHPSSFVASDVNLQEGVQLMAGSIVQTSSYIGCNSILNTKASVDHDCYIGQNCHLAPGVTVSGGVKVEDGVHIGTGASIIQGVSIGKNSLIAAGAVVTQSFPANSKIGGVPARTLS